MHAEQLSAENEMKERRPRCIKFTKTNIVIQLRNRQIETEGPASRKSDVWVLHCLY